MTTTHLWAPRLRLAAVLCLFMLSLAAPRTRVAAAQPVCADGAALWANSRTAAEALSISGSRNTVVGGLRSNADVRISGSNVRISGPITYTSTFQDGGDANSYPSSVQQPAAAAPVSYDIASYRPGGAAAAAAAAAGAYTLVSGDLDLAEPRTLSGLYYVTGNAKLSASQLRGAVTVVAEGEIDVSGSLQQLSPHTGGLLLFSNKSAPGAAVIKLAGGNSALEGAIYGPGGMVELSGSGSSIDGIVFGDTIKLGGSDLELAYSDQRCPGAPTPPAVSAPYAPAEILVKLFSAADLAAVAAANGLDPAPLGQFGARPIFRLRIADGTDPLLKAAQLRPANGGGDQRVEYAEPNYLAQDPESRGRGSWVIGGEDASSYASQWAPATVRLPEAHTRALGAGVTVAVLDTGVDRGHPALQGRLTPGYDFVELDDDPSEEGVYGQNFGFGHGTHVAGLVALAAPAAKIMPVRVLDGDGVGNIWVLSEALLYVVERGPDGVPASGDEPQVINLSLGTTRPTQVLQEIIAEVSCANDDDDDDDDSPRCRATGGALVIAAAGNGGNATPHYPAAEGVAGSLAVGASNRADTRAAFSTFGPWVRLAAPGAEIVSTVPGGGYGVWSGTSMAAPLAAGVAALVKSAEPGIGAPALADRLITTAKPIGGAIPARLDAAAALGIARAPETGARDNRLYMPALRGGSSAGAPVATD